jgi:hypothetical protein
MKPTHNQSRQLLELSLEQKTPTIGLVGGEEKIVVTKFEN